MFEELSAPAMNVVDEECEQKTAQGECGWTC